jgi:Holliday junction resolvase
VSRGLQRERDLVNKLREEGWWAIRSPASKGDVDVVAVKRKGTNLVSFVDLIFVEVKSTKAGPYAGFGPKDREELRAAAEEVGATPWLVWWPPRKKPKWIHADDWPRKT